jgi:hypothetical protein
MEELVELDPRVAGALGVHRRCAKAELAATMARRAGLPAPRHRETVDLWVDIVMRIAPELIDHAPDLAVMDRAEAAHYVLSSAVAGAGRDTWRVWAEDLEANVDDAIRVFLCVDIVPAIADAGYFRLAGRRRMES